MAQLYNDLRLRSLSIFFLLVPIDATAAAPDSRLLSGTAAAALGSRLGGLLLLLRLFLLLIVVLNGWKAID